MVSISNQQIMNGKLLVKTLYYSFPKAITNCISFSLFNSIIRYNSFKNMQTTMKSIEFYLEVGKIKTNNPLSSFLD